MAVQFVRIGHGLYVEAPIPLLPAGALSDDETRRLRLVRARFGPTGEMWSDADQRRLLFARRLYDAGRLSR